MKKNVPIRFLLLVLVVIASCSDKKTENNQAANPVAEEVVKPDSLVDTLVSVPRRSLAYNPDSPSTSREYTDTVKFWKPKKSKILRPTVALDKLFHAWVNDINDPHAAFDLTREGLYVVDYDGDGNMPYILKEDSLIVYYEDEVQRSRIEKLTDDSLILAMDGYKVAYVRWRK